jgi:hypothetical protein
MNWFLRRSSLRFSFVANKSAVSLALIRQMVLRNAGLSNPLDAHRVESLAMFYTSIGDGREGVQAMLEKRKPHFTCRGLSDAAVLPVEHRQTSEKAGKHESGDLRGFWPDRSPWPSPNGNREHSTRPMCGSMSMLQGSISPMGSWCRASI